ncbi:MAG: hypothetical protein KQA40_00030 [Candidatus Aenigmarchaeota archaeon]|nr:hypothetical protein [Candidatus Aenigmarchaeota archaeon]
MDNILELIKEGFLIQPEAKEKIKSLSENQLIYLKERLVSNNSYLISKNFLYKLFPEISIIKNIETENNFLFEENKKISITKYTEKYFRRWDQIQKILSQKVELKDAVSISNASKECIIIGIVFNKKENFFELEDPTGIIKVEAEQELISKISEDDVIAVSGICIEEGKNKKIKAKEIIFPDVPIHKLNLLEYDMEVSFQDNIKFNTDIIFLLSEDNSKIIFDNSETQILNPSLIDINGIKFLYYLGTEYPINILKKRFIQIKKLDFILDIVPDIIITNAIKEPINYKGVSILPLNYKINLKTGEKTKLQL